MRHVRRWVGPTGLRGARVLGHRLGRAKSAIRHTTGAIDYVRRQGRERDTWRNHHVHERRRTIVPADDASARDVQVHGALGLRARARGMASCFAGTLTLSSWAAGRAPNHCVFPPRQARLERVAVPRGIEVQPDSIQCCHDCSGHNHTKAGARCNCGARGQTATRANGEIAMGDSGILRPGQR